MTQVGIDIIEIRRFAQARFIERACDFFLAEKEQLELQTKPDKLQYIASRFAVKEAIIKAIPETIGFLDFEVIKPNTKYPVVHFFQKKFQKYIVVISLSHSTDYVAGFALVTY